MYQKNLLFKAIHENKFSSDQINAFIQLFKIAPTSECNKTAIHTVEDAAKVGLLFVTEDRKLMTAIPETVFNAARNLYGNESNLFNQTFYKSFAKVRDASPYELLFNQLLHYFTTYGAEQLSMELPTYVPMAVLELPENEYNKDFKFTVIRVVSDAECIKSLDDYLYTLRAPSQFIMRAVDALLPLATLATDDIESFEVQIKKHTLDGTVPSNPVSQLRYIIYRITGETLIIKNKSLRNKIKFADCANTILAYDLLNACDRAGLASIFFRFKPLFLAFKEHYMCSPLVNDLRRKADIFHKPLSQASLQNLTSITDKATIAKIIGNASNRDLVKVLNSLYSRMVENTTPSIIAVRNGRTFVKSDGITPLAGTNELAATISQELVHRLAPVLSGKRFYMPSYIEYAIPTTEKQFIGNIPFGSQILGVPDGAFTVGIQWFNQKNTRVDIDLHLNSATQHFGWNAMHRRGNDVLYTGDLTDAPIPNGAAEAYWFNPEKQEAYVVSANLYSGCEETEYKFFMTEVKPTVMGSDRGFNRQSGRYTYNPNEAVCPAIPLRFEKSISDMNIGMIADGRFFFYGGTLSNGIVPSANYGMFIQGLTAQLRNKAMLRSLLLTCGASVLTEKEIAEMNAEDMATVVSLTPEDLTANTLTNIIDGIL